MRAIDYFDIAAEAFPDRAALIDGNNTYNYRELRAASERVERSMWANGLRDEDRVAILSPNDARVLVCMLGLMCAGGACGDQLTSLPGLGSILGILLHLSQATVAQRPELSKMRNS